MNNNFKEILKELLIDVYSNTVKDNEEDFYEDELIEEQEKEIEEIVNNSKPKKAINKAPMTIAIIIFI